MGDMICGCRAGEVVDQEVSSNGNTEEQRSHISQLDGCRLVCLCVCVCVYFHMKCFVIQINESYIHNERIVFAKLMQQ